MSERKKLKEDIANTLKSESVRKNSMSYDEWLSRKGYDSESLANKELEARMSAERALASYGARAESTAGSGADGYADYISKRAAMDESRAADEVRRERTLGNAERLKGYSNYIHDVADGIERKRDTLIEKMMNGSKIDSKSVYSLAISYGLSEGDARELEKQARSIKTSGSASVKNEVLNTVIREGMDEERAYRYALACGISEGDADRIAGIASYYKRDMSNVTNMLNKRSDVTQELGLFDRMKKMLRQSDEIY